MHLFDQLTDIHFTDSREWEKNCEKYVIYSHYYRRAMSDSKYRHLLLSNDPEDLLDYDYKKNNSLTRAEKCANKCVELLPLIFCNN